MADSYDLSPELEQCQITGQMLPADQIVELHGYRVGPEGKQILLDRLASGEPLQGVAAESYGAGWSTTRGGLTTIYIGWIIMGILYVLGALAFLVLGLAAGVDLVEQIQQMEEGGDPPPTFFAFIGVGCLFVIGFLGTAIAIFVGKCMCCATPQESEARGLAIGSVICTAVATAISFVPILSLLQGPISLVGTILFLLFLRKVNLYLGDAERAQSVIRFIIASVVLFGVAIVGGIAMVIMFASALPSPGSGPPEFEMGPAVVLLIAVSIVMVIAWIVMYFWYLRLLKGTRDTIALVT